MGKDGKATYVANAQNHVRCETCDIEDTNRHVNRLPAGWRRTSFWEYVIPTIRLSAYVWTDLQAGQRLIDRRHHICSQGSLCQGTGVFLDLSNCTEAGNW
ncbi:hypothetical protein C9417_14040 [Rhizobium sp. SEMIA 4088]|uniref:Uncharacterized protein n=1 Tax=Rhizobium tropici TaxID=398 RepID=A0A6P1C9K8_RHITR|nr:hypothetical protein [Rhizobium tropici]TGE97624.1 hypothetical protein C9417_14040 [Rhizobium sp. SEMIA 4088]